MATQPVKKDAKIAFLTGLPQDVLDIVTSHAPAGFETTIVDGDLPERDQIDAGHERFAAIGQQFEREVIRPRREARYGQELCMGVRRLPRSA